MERLKLTNKDKAISYRKSGKGKTVVLIHGFGEDSSVWSQQEQAFENYQLIIPDLPGSGESELTESLSMETMAEAIQQILEQENVSSAAIIGHSMGGYVALAFAEKFADKLSALGLVHSTAFADDDARKEKRKAGIKTLQSEGSQAYFSVMIPDLFSAASAEGHLELLDKQLAKAAQFPVESSVAYLNAMMQRPERTGVLQHLEVPFMLILGAEDKTIPLESGMKNASLAPDTDLHILEKSGHLGMLEEAEEFNQILKQFLLRIK